MNNSHDWKTVITERGKPWMPSGGAAFDPYTFQRPDGSTATVVGNRCGILIVDGHHTSETPLEYTVRGTNLLPNQGLSPAGASLDRIVRTATETMYNFPVSSIRNAVGPSLMCVPNTEKDCPECSGSGEVTCYACDHEHDCDDCDGTGKVFVEGHPDPKVLRVAALVPILIDALVVAQLLSLVPDGSVRMVVASSHPNRSPVSLAGDGWTLMIMPLYDVPDDAKVIEWNGSEVLTK